MSTPQEHLRPGIGAVVALVRQVLGWTQAELAVKADLSQGYISKVEAGALELAEPYLTQISTALMCPPELIAEPELILSPGVSCVHHRRKKSRLSVASIKRVEGMANLSSLTITRLVEHLPTGEMRAGIDLIENTGLTPRDAAQSVRIHAGNDLRAPISSVSRIVEELGVPILRRYLTAPTQKVGAAGQDGISLSGAGRHPLIVVNNSLAPDRERFTIAHELGHLVLHRGMAASADDDIEEEANDFAANLLLPSEVMNEVLVGLSDTKLRYLMELKHEWGVSIAALIQQARRLNVIDAETHKSLRIRLVRMGWDKLEPGEVAAEEPTLVGNIIRKLHTLGFTNDQLAGIALMREADFNRVYLTQ